MGVLGDMQSMKLIVALALCASVFSTLSPDSTLPEALVEQLPYDVDAAVAAFIQSRGNNDLCIKEANLSLKTVTDSVASESSAFAQLDDGSQCHLKYKEEVLDAETASKQAAIKAAEAGTALSNAGEAKVSTSFTFSNMVEGKCEQLFASQSYRDAKSAYTNAKTSVTRAQEAKRMADGALKSANDVAAKQINQCYCDANKAHEVLVKQVATSSQSNDKLWKVANGILCAIDKKNCDSKATPTPTVKPLVSAAQKATCQKCTATLDGNVIASKTLTKGMRIQDLLTDATVRGGGRFFPVGCGSGYGSGQGNFHFWKCDGDWGKIGMKRDTVLYSKFSLQVTATRFTKANAWGTTAPLIVACPE